METPYQLLYDYFLIQSYMNIYQIIGFLILCIAYYLKIRDVFEEVSEMEAAKKKERQKC